MIDQENHVELLSQLAQALHYPAKNCLKAIEGGLQVSLDDKMNAIISLYCAVLTARAAESRRQHEELTR